MLCQIFIVHKWKENSKDQILLFTTFQMIMKFTLKFFEVQIFFSFLIMESYNVINFKTCLSVINPRRKELISVE